MTATEVVEDALRAYVPPASAPPFDGLIRRGPVLVKPAEGRRVSQDEADAALAGIRGREL